MKILKLFLTDKHFSQNIAPKIRGFIASRFPGEVMLHNHDGSSGFVYQYPKIQYKVIDSVPLIIGIEEGVSLVLRNLLNLEEMNINDKTIEIMEKKIEISNEEFGDTEEVVRYRFMSPWMGLNQKNHRLFQNSETKDRRQLLCKNIANNIISLSKSLGYTVKNRLQAQFSEEPVEVNFKDQKILCFKGVFAINFMLPDYIGIGKSVSRGFGSVKKIGIKEV